MKDHNNRIVVSGDWHGHVDWATNVIAAAAEAKVSYLLHVGDFGVGLSGRGYERFLSEIADRFDVTIYVIPGNHDHHDLINQTMRIAERDVDGFAILHDRIRIAPRAHTWRWQQRSFASLMGAYSIDKDYREPGVSWWPQEEPTADDLAALLSEAGEITDVLIGHDVPEGTPVRSHFQLPAHHDNASRRTRQLLALAVDELRPQVVFAGHWHQRLTHQRTSRTRVEVLDMEYRAGNSVVLDLKTLAVTPLPVLNGTPQPAPPGEATGCFRTR